MGGMTQNYAPGTPSWVDLGTTDVAGAAAFYGGLFGWTLDELGPEAGGYGIFRKNGKQVAGVGPATDAGPGTSWVTYFAADADDAASRVAANGGQVVAAPMDVMDQGRMAVFADPTGAFFSVWQAGKHTGAELVNEPGSFTWNELLTSNIDVCKDFYPQVLGVSIRDVSVDGGMTYTLLQVGGRGVAGAKPQRAEDPGPSRWSVYFAVDDCDAAHAKGVGLGATSVMAPEDTPAGRMAFLTDPQGGTFAIIRNNPDFSM
jgi:predicted enzyme related to lactoylglutathione lyase